jgi:phosphoribosylformylglycinamidine synthase
MIVFYTLGQDKVYALQYATAPKSDDRQKLIWLLGGAQFIEKEQITGFFTGPRCEMVSPWSTNAVEITRNMGITGVERIEEFDRVPNADASYDPMLQQRYNGLDQSLFDIERQPEPVRNITDILAYNQAEGLALSAEEIDYLNGVSNELGRPLTDSEIFGFSQVNSEHCRHKIFNGKFVLDGQEKPMSLFELIKKTTAENPNRVVSAYKDNVAFIEGPRAEQFAPSKQDESAYFETTDFDAVISIKAETHNFPTTVEPFNGAATGSGGEIRDRMAGGRGSMPLAGTAVYMTAYSRLQSDRHWENEMPERPWRYQTPMDILIKASNGASDFGNKFGQPLINGSVLTFEHQEGDMRFGFDKVIMLAGGIGYAKKEQAAKGRPLPGDYIVVMGGDNYRIGMGGGAVSSVATGEFSGTIELNAIQRSNPEMQKRVYNVIRALAEATENPIVSIHDHGAGGHLNCLSELVEEIGGVIDIEKLPVGDPTLSDKEIIGNESQERMGLIVREKDLPLLIALSERERAPMYVVGRTTGDHRFVFENRKSGKNPMDWELRHMFGSSPRTLLTDTQNTTKFAEPETDDSLTDTYLHDVLRLEAVACKDWLTNKVDRCVTGRVAKQPCAGPLQLPLNNLGIMAIDFRGKSGIATAMGHAPVAALADPVSGSQLAIAEALTNIMWAPITGGLQGVSLSANWMWPAKNPGENDRLYRAVEAVSEMACALHINIPTGKDSLSMTQKYADGVVFAPGTVIISAVAEVEDIRKTVEPVLQPQADSQLIYINFSGDTFALAGSSLAQTRNAIGNDAPRVDTSVFGNGFSAIQECVGKELLLAGHDISAGGMVTALLEMCFALPCWGMSIDLSAIAADTDTHLFFSEQSGAIIQVSNAHLAEVQQILLKHNAIHALIGNAQQTPQLDIKTSRRSYSWHTDTLRDVWYETSHLLDRRQSGNAHADRRFENYKKQPLTFVFPDGFEGSYAALNLQPNRKNNSGIRAAIIREKGVNGDREMAYALHLAGFDVKDVHMTDLIAGREDLSDVNMIAFVGGFSNSDVLGSAKGWAGAFMFNEKAKMALDLFYARPDTLSLGICNGCQVMMELGLLYPDMQPHPTMHHNSSGKFESGFVNVDIPQNNSVMLGPLAGLRMGIWVAHGEGRFDLPLPDTAYQITAHYSYDEYPGNPNGSDYAAAGLCSRDGRHLAIMPHFERSIFSWNWGHYPATNKGDMLSPWILAFINAREWVEKSQPRRINDSANSAS